MKKSKPIGSMLAMAIAMGAMMDKVPYYKRNHTAKSTGKWHSYHKPHQNTREKERRLRTYPSMDLALYRH